MIPRANRSGLRLGLLLALCGLVVPASAQEKPGPEQVIRDFYRWYVEELVTERDPFEEGRADLQRYVTPRLLKEIDDMRTGPDGLDADYFLSAQDFDKEWAKNVSVSEVNIQGDRASASVELKGTEMENHKLRVGLAQEDGAWKIDLVEGREDHATESAPQD